jgi:hypothetical protein
MIGFKQYLFSIIEQQDKDNSMEYNTVEKMLKSMGFDNIKKISGSKVAVLTDSNRISVLEKIQKGIKGSVYDTKPGSDSSAGRVKIGNISILAKPASKQGKASAGVENEDIVVNTINSFAKTGPINVLFKGLNKSFNVLGCTLAKSVGADTAGRKKADIVLIDSKGQNYPISIKKDDAETWESADSYFSAEAKRIIDAAIENGDTKLIHHGSYFTIEPNIAVPATQKEKRDVVFGSDIEGKGCIITKTFTSNSFTMKEDTLEIEVTHIIDSMADVKGPKDVMFLIRNDKTRKSIKEYPGIRILAAYAKRINKNVKVVKR